MSKELFTQFLGTIFGVVVRVALASIGGWLISNGYATHEDIQTISAGFVLLGVVIVLSLLQKYKVLRLLDAAMELPAHTSLQKVREKADEKLVELDR